MTSTQRRNGWTLIVEDEPHQARALSRLLCSEFEVRVAATVREALEVIASNGTVRLVLTDMSLPGGRQKYGGLDVLDYVVDRLPDVPCAAVTGILDPCLDELLAERRTPMLPKPIGRATLDPLIDRALAFPIRSERLALHVIARVRGAHLTPVQRAVLCWLVAGRERADFCALHGTLASTFDWHVDELRKKFDGRPRIEALVGSLLREVIEPPRRRGG